MSDATTLITRLRRLVQRPPRGRRRWPLPLALAALATAALPQDTTAHDIPSTVTVLIFARPEGHTLRLIVRAPLDAMRDIDWPVTGPGYLDIAASAPLLRQAATTWIAGYLQLYADGRRLPDGTVAAAIVSLPSDRSFGSYDAALAHVTGPALPEATEIVWQQASIDVLLEYPIQSDSARFAIRPALAQLGLHTTTVLRFLPPGRGRAERDFEYLGDPGLVRLDPHWYQAALAFVELGIAHILTGIDHLLFIICLVIPFRRLKPLLAIITAFTVAHSITLIASASGFAPSALWFPPLIEMLIAASIVYMALENIVGAKLQRRWLIAFGFGLVHGFGFSFALRRSLQFAGAHLATALFSFNLGVELGQLLVLVLAVPTLNLLFRYVVTERLGIILASALVAHQAWHWMTDRWSALSQYQFQWPTLDTAFVIAAMRWLMLALVLVGAVWGLFGLVRGLVGAEPDQPPIPALKRGLGRSADPS
jgi:HupE / UreJ protein